MQAHHRESVTFLPLLNMTHEKEQPSVKVFICFKLSYADLENYAWLLDSLYQP